MPEWTRGLFRPWMLVLASAALHLSACPHTKVEESFNVQAIHDVVYLGVVNTSSYDHLSFPGVVPRTFLGPLAVSAVSLVPIKVLHWLGATKVAALITVRAVLGLFVLSGLAHFQRSLRPLLGSRHALWHSLITASQFHLPFYITRPLPNVFALAVTLHALALWLGRRDFGFVLTAAAAVLVFRGELALLFGAIVLTELALGRRSLGKIILHGAIALLVWLPLTVTVDTYFWNSDSPLWPEGRVLYYNVVLNKSSGWGTEPWPWYFANCLPRALFLSLPLVLLGLYLEQRTLRLAFPALAFVFLYSFLPHKETRFVLYAFPMLNACAAAACDHLWRGMGRGWWRTALALGAATHLLGNLLYAGAALSLSARNYPGGEAMQLLHRSVAPDTYVVVHLDNLACQTGASRFTQLTKTWAYDKTEGLSLSSRLSHDSAFTHLVTEPPSTPEEEALAADAFDVLGRVEQTDGVSLDWGVVPPVRLRTKTALLIMQRKGWTENQP